MLALLWRGHLCTLPLSETRPFSFHLYLLYHFFSHGNDTVLSEVTWACPLSSSSITSWSTPMPLMFRLLPQMLIFSNIILSLEEIILPDISRKDEFFPAFIKRKKNYTSDCLTLPKSHKPIICPRIKAGVSCQLEINMLKSNKNIILMEWNKNPLCRIDLK